MTRPKRWLQHSLRCPFSQARMIEVTEAAKVIYMTEHLPRRPVCVRTRTGRGFRQVEKILRHCGLWDEPAAPAPPSTAVAVEG